MWEIGDELDTGELIVGDEFDDWGEDDFAYDDYGDEEMELAALLGQRVAPPRRSFVRRRRPSLSRLRGMKRRALLSRAAAVAKAVKTVEQGTLLRSKRPTKSREFPIGFDSVTDVLAGATATITTRPQIIFRPERIIVPAAVAVFFQIVDVKVGKDSQLVAAGNIPAATFAETAFGVRLKMDTVQISQDLILIVTNIDVANHRFQASMIGEAVES